MAYLTDEEFDDDQLDDDWIEDEDSEDVFLVCPSCQEDVHEDTQQCPYCGDWIIPAYPSRPFKQWFVVGITLLLVGLLVLMTVF